MLILRFFNGILQNIYVPITLITVSEITPMKFRGIVVIIPILFEFAGHFYCLITA